MIFTTNDSNVKWYEGAWKLLYSSNYDKVYKIALSIVIDRELAKDVTQEVFLSAFLKINTLKEIDKFSSWICTIAENTGKNIPDNIIRFCDSNNPEQTYELKENSKEVLHYIEELGLEEQRILSLKYYDGFSYTQIAEQMNLKESTVRMRAHRAKDKITINLQKNILKGKTDMKGLGSINA